MGRYRDKLADRIRDGYSCRTLFWSYFIVLLIIGIIVLLIYLNDS